ncbi:MAG: hypothetical protein PVH74_13630 [Desulfobacterales bacterium]|jgi:hypothetical protein
MDQSFKQQLLLSIIDKILFGLIILIISVVFNYYVEKKINEIDRREQRRYQEAELLRQKADRDAASARQKDDQEAARLNQILQSVSRVNSDLVVEQRKGLTEYMGMYFMEVDSHAPAGQMTQEGLKELNKIRKNIKISIYQIDALSPDFSTNERVRSFLKTLNGCNIYLETEKKLTKYKILAKLDEVKKAYTELLEEIRQISIKLARIDYDRAKPDVVDRYR